MNKDMVIREVEYPLEDGSKGKMAIFTYLGDADPKKELEKAIKKYTAGQNYYTFIDAQLNNPWTQMIMSDINGMKQEHFDTEKHFLPVEEDENL